MYLFFPSIYFLYFPLTNLSLSLSHTHSLFLFFICFSLPLILNLTYFIFFTYSGTTGAPKGVMRDNGGHAVALKYSMKTIFGMKEGDTFMACSDIGWVVGHSYIVYGPLLNRTRSILYEGKPIGTPDAGQYWRMIDKYKVNSMFTAPTALRAIKRDDPTGSFIKIFNLSSLRTMFVAGERADPDTLKFFYSHLNIPIIDHYWQTETGWPMCSMMVGLGVLKTKYGTKCSTISRDSVNSSTMFISKTRFARLEVVCSKPSKDLRRKKPTELCTYTTQAWRSPERCSDLPPCLLTKASNERASSIPSSCRGCTSFPSDRSSCSIRRQMARGRAVRNCLVGQRYSTACRICGMQF